MEIIFRFINLACSVFVFIFTILMLISYRKERHFQPINLLVSAMLSLLIITVFVWISGVRLNLIIAIPLFLLGALFGFIRGFGVKLYFRGKLIYGKFSLISLLAWGGSYGLAILMNSFDSALLASLGLIPLCFSTGTQTCLNGLLFLRCIVIRPTLAKSI